MTKQGSSTAVMSSFFKASLIHKNESDEFVFRPHMLGPSNYMLKLPSLEVRSYPNMYEKTYILPFKFGFWLFESCVRKLSGGEEMIGYKVTSP